MIRSTLEPMTMAIVLAAAIVAASAALLVGSGTVISREMSWDLLFNLAGAWHLEHGQLAHVDFLDPVGATYFRLTQLGFWLYGPSPMAFMAGTLVATLVIFSAAAAASMSRLPPIATLAFILFASLMVLMPVNVGDDPTDFTFAMTYNAYGWAAISILSLLLFVPRRRAREGSWIDAAIGALMMVAMYHLKITYFAASLAALAAAFALCGHVRRQSWLVAGGSVAAYALVPANWPYLVELSRVLATPGSLAVYVESGEVGELLRSNVAELALYAFIGAIAIARWATGRAPWRLPVAIAFLTFLGAILLVFNAQTRGIPLGIVTSFLLYRHLRRDHGLRLAAPVLLLPPFLLAAAAAASVTAYYFAATGNDGLLIVDSTNLQGLAVPDDDPTIRPGEEIDQETYVASLLEAASLLRHTGNGGQGVVLLDQVNPMPFVMGQPPQRGARLWLSLDLPWPRTDAMFAGVHHVLIPKRPTYAAVKDKALELYSAYINRNFRKRTESRSWILLSRLPPSPNR